MTRLRRGGNLVHHRHTTGGTDLNVKRWTLCLVRGHRWARIPYPGNDDGDEFFLRCTSCRYENHNAAMPGRPSGLV